MRTSIREFVLPFVLTLVIGSTLPTFGQLGPSVFLVPYGNDKDGNFDADVIVEPNGVIMPSGDRLVFFDVRVGDWDPDDTGVTVKAYQFFALRDGVGGDSGTVSLPLGCTTDEACEDVFGAESGCLDVEVCGANGCCGTGQFNATQPDFLFFGLPSLPACDHTKAVRCGNTLLASQVDDPEPFPAAGLHLGRFAVYVSADADGAFDIHLDAPPNTMLVAGNSELIVPTLRSGRICIGALADCAEDCNENGVSDAVELTYAPDCDANGILDACEYTPEPSTPKNRYLTVLTNTLFGSHAIAVTLTDLAAPFDIHNDRTMWVGRPYQMSINGHNIGPVPGYLDFAAADLRCEPYFDDWSGYGFVEVTGENIVPQSSYTVEVFAEDGFGNPVPTGDVRSKTTNLWGDAVGNFDAAVNRWAVPDQSVDIVSDAISLLDLFTSRPCAPNKVQGDLWPQIPDGAVNIVDVTMVVDAFKSEPYPFQPGLWPCE